MEFGTTAQSQIKRPAIPEGPYLVVGLARSGQSAARLLASRGQTVIGVDSGKPDGIDTLADYGVETHPESDGVDLLDRVTTIIKSPGVPKEAPVMAAAQAAAKVVIGELELGWRLLPNRFIAVTGTNGKTTTTELLGAIFEAANVPYATAGNVGTPVCELVGAISPEAVVIAETSSFQLEDAPAFNPEVAILLNLAPDHLDRHGTFEEYVEAKLSMFARQGPAQHAVLGPTISVEVPGQAQQTRIYLDAPHSPIAMRGDHNAENALTASAAARALHVPFDAIEKALATFRGVEHRMEEFAQIDGITYINDSKATNVAAASVALLSFDGGVHAIFGGSLKGESFEGLKDPIAKSCAGVYLIGEAGPEIANQLFGITTPITFCGTLDAAIDAAKAAAQPGNTILLTPACASFDQFDNYEHRGAEFKRLVEAKAN
jgi:UDP-N-acetylmuramoylalanine--D-glutamate ligase